MVLKRLFAEPFTWAAGAMLLLPLALVRFAPTADLPHHVAFAGLLWRIAWGDPAAVAHYMVTLQPVPYYLAYVLLVPAVALCGPILGARLALAGCALATLAAGRRLARATDSHPAALLGCVFAFYSLNFYWGFISTLVGLPPFLASLAASVEARRTPSRRRLLEVAAWTALTVAAHVLWLLPLAPCLALAACARLDGRPPRAKNRVAALAIGVVLLAAALVARGGAALLLPNGMRLTFSRSPFYFGTLLTGHLRGLALGPGLALHVALLAALLLTAVGRGWRTRTGGVAPARWLLGQWALALALLSLAMPASIVGPHSFALLLDFRWLGPLEAVAWLALLPRASKPLAAALTVGTLAFVADMYGAWHATDTDARAVELMLARLPDHQRVFVDKPVHPGLPGIEPHVGDQNCSFYLAARGAYASDLFDDAHIPVHARHKLRGEVADGTPTEMGDFDVFLQFPGPGNLPHPPGDATPVATAAGWHMYKKLAR